MEKFKKRLQLHHNNHLVVPNNNTCANLLGPETASNNSNYRPTYQNNQTSSPLVNNVPNHGNTSCTNINNNNNNSTNSNNSENNGSPHSSIFTPHYISNSNSHHPSNHLHTSRRTSGITHNLNNNSSSPANLLPPKLSMFDHGAPSPTDPPSRKHSIISRLSIPDSIRRAFSIASVQAAPPRLVTTCGKRNIGIINVPFSARQLNNAFRYMVNLHWALQMCLIAGVFFLSWSVFGLLWWTLHSTQGHLIKSEQCLANVDSFYAALLFSLETQTTIGFGHRYVNSSCHSAVMLLWLQMMVSMVLDSTMIAIILSKITHPKWRQSTIYFSDALCISKRDDEYVLSLRVADMSTGSMPEAHVRMYLVHSTTDTHGNNCLLMEDLDVGYDCGRDRLILLVPWIIEHRIDAESPLFKKSWHDIQSVHFEVIVLLEGAVEETGSTAQVIQSYTASDIKWGYNFASMLTRKGNKYLSDFDKLNSVIGQSDMPTCSLYELLGEDDLSESEAPSVMRKRAFSTIYDIPPTLTEETNEDA
ncbi:G protein-activated inward rectifier potassium channel 3-like isoform X2 [Symsagittifera roscoffensis]|uniref:G protein-activated inward rectifier potassium channel 3-like isoform X2 n=1 Tax=Symsagittifera roscoffensis TaxID=84072 RepID=UPI00307B5786